MHSVTETLKGPHKQFYVQGVKALKPNHPEVLELREQGHTPCEFGSRIWRSSYLLIHYLANYLDARIARAIELGCGWGLGGLYLQKHCGVEVAATDIDSNVFAYQELLCRHNATRVPIHHCSVQELGSWDLQPVDLLIGADICYTAEIARHIETLCLQLAHQGGGQLVLADSGRAPFLALSKHLARRYPLEMTHLTLDLPTRVSGQVLHVEMPG